LSQLADFFSQILPHYDEVIFTGDFNLRLLSEPRVCEQLNDLLMSFSLFQHVNQPTHERGDILDLVITRTASTILSSISLTPGVADHLSIILDLSIAHTIPSTIITSVRKFNDSNIQQIKLLMRRQNDLFLDYLTNISVESVENLVSYFLSQFARLFLAEKDRLIYHGLTPTSGGQNVSSDSLKGIGDLTKHKKLSSSIHKHDLLFTPYFKKPN
jgi:hypothetical protein